jgi:hypothetical protein
MEQGQNHKDADRAAYLLAGTRVIWTDPDGGTKHHGTVRENFDPTEDETVSVATDAGGDLEAMPHELVPDTDTSY